MAFLRAPGQVSLTFLVTIPELQVFLQERFERIEHELRSRKLTNFKLYGEAVLQILPIIMHRFSGFPGYFRGKKIKDTSRFIGLGEFNNVTWEIDAVYDLSEAYNEQPVELHIKLQPTLIHYRGVSHPYVSSFVVWISWVLPKPRSIKSSNFVRRLYFDSTEFPILVAEFLNYVPFDESQLKEHIKVVGEKIRQRIISPVEFSLDPFFIRYTTTSGG